MPRQSANTEARVLLVLLPVFPALLVTLLYPAGGTVSDSLATSGTIAAQIGVVLGLLAGIVVEWLVLSDALTLYVLPFFAFTVLTTHDMETLEERDRCDMLCGIHSIAFLLLVAAELFVGFRRGYSWLILVPAVVVMVVSVTLYSLLVSEDGFDVTKESDRREVAVLGATELLLFVLARLLTALDGRRRPSTPVPTSEEPSAPTSVLDRLFSDLPLVR